MRSWWIALLLLVGCSSSASPPKELATLEGGVDAIAVDASHVYLTFLELGRPSIVRIPRTGGPAELVTKIEGVGVGIAVSDGQLYWVEVVDTEPGSAGRISRIVTRAVAGGATTELARYDGMVTGMVVDDRTIYLMSIGVHRGGEIDPVEAGSVIAVPRAGGAVTVLASKLTRPLDLGLDATTVYWKDDGGIWKLAKTGGTPAATTTMPEGTSSTAFVKTVVDGNTRFRAESKFPRTTISAAPR